VKQYQLPVLLLTVIGLCVSLGFSGHIMQPDWALALLLASLFAYRNSWPWVLPGIAAHDVILYWSVWGSLPLAAAVPFLLSHIDRDIGTALIYRVILAGVVCCPLLWFGTGFIQWLLTFMLCVPLWHWLTRRHAIPA